MSKNTRYMLRLDIQDKIAWQAAAKQAGLSLAEWITFKCNQSSNPVVHTSKPDAMHIKPKIIKTVEDALASIPKTKTQPSTRWNERPIEVGGLLKKR